MAQSLHQSASSSAPSTWSLNPSTSSAGSRWMVDGVQHRRNVFVDGDRIRISETPRRRRPREIGAAQVSALSSSSSSKSSSEIPASHNKPAAASQSPVIHQSIASPVDELSSRTRHDSFMDIASLVSDSWCQPSRPSSEVSYQHVMSSPPPTPKIQQLPTPDLKLLEADSFCDCQACCAMSNLSIGENCKTKSDTARCY